MKDETITQVIVISDNDPVAFQQRVNEALQKHTDTVSIDYKDNAASLFSVIITYREHKLVEENSKDYFANRGKRYCCNDCPHLELDPDRRSRTHYCKLFDDRVALTRSACEHFLSALKSGADHLVTPRERKDQYDRMDAEELERRRARTREIKLLRYHKQKMWQEDKARKSSRKPTK